MKKAIIFCLMILGPIVAAEAVSIQVPWDEANQRYYLKFEGYDQIVSGNYDPDVISGTYQKQNGDKWIATTWASDGSNYGQWTYQFVGGPADNNVAGVTVKVLCYQAGSSNYHYAQFSTDGSTWSTVYSLTSGTAYTVDWRGTTFGSYYNPLNVDTIYVKDTIHNGWYTTAVQTRGMEIIGFAEMLPPDPVAVPWDEASGTYTLTWEGLEGVNSGLYDPTSISGTYQKENGDKWVATTWNYPNNWGQWEYTFDGPVESVTASLYIYQYGAFCWNAAVWGTTTAEADTRFANEDWLFEIDNFTTYNDWYPVVLGSGAEPLNTDRICLRHIIANGNTEFASAGQLRGMTITAIPSEQIDPIPGDANSDGQVDVGDLGILAANYGLTSGATWAQGDFNGDGQVDVGDLGILAANYGVGASGADFDADYAKVFGVAANDEESSDLLCGSLGLPLILGLALMGLMLLKVKE